MEHNVYIFCTQILTKQKANSDNLNNEKDYSSSIDQQAFALIGKPCTSEVSALIRISFLNCVKLDFSDNELDTFTPLMVIQKLFRFVCNFGSF